MLLSTVLFSAASGTSFRIGSAISRIGLICATETATAAREEKAPISMPKAVLKPR